MQIVTTHKNTDFDGLAASIAVTLIHPEATAVLPKALNPNVKAFLSIHKDLFPVKSPADVDLSAVTRLIVVDTNQWKRLDRMDALKNRAGIEIVVYDHHDVDGTIRASKETREIIGAVTTLLVRELKQHRISLTPIQATLLLTGIYEDTGHLTFPSTTAEDAYAAGWLLEKGADLDILSTFLKPAYSEKHKAVLFALLQNARRTKVKGHRISIGKAAIHGHIDNLAVVVRMLMEIVNVDAAFGIFNNSEKGRCMVIGRSQSDALDVGAILRSMGGGGHPRAASAQIKDANPDALEQWILELIRGNQQASVQVSDLMSFPVVTISPGASMEEAARMLRRKGITGVPVVNGGRVVGMISRRDFRRLRKESQLHRPVKSFMSVNPQLIEPGKSPMQAARIMVKHDVGRLPVVEDGRLIGIVSRSDIMRYFYDLLPD